MTLRFTHLERVEPDAEENFPRGFVIGALCSAALWLGLWVLADLWWLP